MAIVSRMKEQEPTAKAPHNLGLVRHEDRVQPFMLHNSVVRGRMVRLDKTLNTILERHAYPPIVSHMLAELLVLASMLSANLPEEGILTFQAKGDGAVAFFVADVRHGGCVRAYANIREDGHTYLEGLDATSANLRDVMGGGYLAITLDYGYGDPYQGIVPLEGQNFSEALTHYFLQSQQLDVIFYTQIHKHTSDHGAHHWVIGGIMLERMPELSMAEQTASDQLEPADMATDAPEDHWEFCQLLVHTITEEELCDPHLALSALLYRLFHEIGVWVYDTHTIKDECHCSPTRFIDVLRTIPRSELEEMAIDGCIEMTCQFCSRTQHIPLEQL
ncbi:MAG: molecular chaperone Hsp33 [Alphaproteobacteria bacterium]|nr:MAG: molecular chaperone Hsp33 [Alphaproteobacteria bacterium]